MPFTKKWSLKFDRCLKCGRNDVKHRARGLCVYCYEREQSKRSRGSQRIAYGLASRKLNCKYLYEEYVDKKRSLSDIAKECNCGRQYVYKRMRDLDIPLRTQSEARKLAYDRHKVSYKIVDENGNEHLVIQGSLKVNERFFESWSKEMGYVLGIIYTDGNLYFDPKRKTYRIILSQKEPELLTKVLRLMDCNARIRHRRKRGIAGALHFFDFHHPKIYHDLINLGLSPDKSKTINFPDIPPEFLRHFVRGCWDGDGSIYFEGPAKIRGSYTCGSFKFIEKLVQELYRAGISKTKPPLNKIERDKMWLDYPDARFPLKIHEEKRSKSYYIKIDTKDNLEKLFHYLYDGVDESMYLERKFKTFVKGLGVIADGLQKV